MILSMIAATSRNACIGIDNSIPWKCKSDMLHFKDYTMGKTVLMGRKTFESLPGLLAGRTTIVLTSSEEGYEKIVDKVNLWKEKNPGKEVPLIMGCMSLEQLFHSDILEDLDELVVCGGGQLYEQLYDVADKFVHTLIDVKLDGSTYFLPNQKVDLKGDWVRSEKESVPWSQNEGDEYRYYINTYYRKNSGNVFSFTDKHKMSKLEMLRLTFR